MSIDPAAVTAGASRTSIAAERTQFAVECKQLPTVDELNETIVESERRHPAWRGRFKIEQTQIYSAMNGLVLGGAIYPIIFGLIAVAWETMQTSARGLPVAIVICAVFTLCGMVIGACLAGFLGVLCTTLLSIFHYTTRCRFHPKALVHLAGGLTGFMSIMLVSAEESVRGDQNPGLVIFAATLGMAVCQFATTIAYARKYGDYQRADTQKEFQFGIFDMFVGVTWAAAIIAFLGLFPQNVMPIAGIWLVLQIYLSVISHMVHRHLTVSGR